MNNKRIVLGMNLKKIRENKNISLANLSREINIDSQRIRRLEKGLTVKIDVTLLIKICDILEIDLIELLENSGFFDKENDENYEVFIIETGDKNIVINSKDVAEILAMAFDYIFGMDEILGIDYDKNVDNLKSKHEINRSISTNKNCKNCEYYCPICDECTYFE